MTAFAFFKFKDLQVNSNIFTAAIETQTVKKKNESTEMMMMVFTDFLLTFIEATQNLNITVNSII